MTQYETNYEELIDKRIVLRKRFSRPTREYVLYSVTYIFYNEELFQKTEILFLLPYYLWKILIILVAFKTNCHLVLQ